MKEVDKIIQQADKLLTAEEPHSIMVSYKECGCPDCKRKRR